MAANDIQAAKSFVTLYIRDHAFRRQLAENAALLDEFAQGGGGSGAIESNITPSIEGYQEFAVTADEAMQLIYDDTMYLTEATQELNQALLEVMDTYMGLAEMQGEGITLNAGGRGIGGPAETGKIEGATWEDAMPRMIEEAKAKAIEAPATIATAAIGSIGESIGSTIGENIGKPLGDAIVEKIKGVLPAALEKIPAIGGGLSSLTSGALGAPGATTSQAAGIVMAEIVPAASAATAATAAAGTAATVATPAVTAFSAALATLTPLLIPIAIGLAALVPILAAVDDEAGGALTKSGLYPAWLKKIGDALNFFLPIGAIVKTVSAVLQQLWSVIKLVGEALLVLLIPVLAPIALQLKLCQMAVSAFMAVTRLLVAGALLPLKAALWLIILPFRLVKLAIDALLLPFTLARKACEYFIAGLKLIPSIASAAWTGIQKLSSWAWSTAKAVGSAAVSIVKSIGSMVIAVGKATVALGRMAVTAVWDGMVGSVNLVADAITGIGTATKWAGGLIGSLGKGLESLAARIVSPLTQAADKFQEHGETISRLAKGYKISAQAASVYNYVIGQTNRMVGEKGGAGAGYRMQENRMGKLIKTMKEGSAEYERWRKQAEASGMVLEGIGVESALAMDDAMDRLRDSLKGLWIQLGSAVAPIIVESTEVMAGAVRGAIAWVRENKGLIASAFQVAKVVAGVGAALGIVGTVLVTIGSAISPLTAALAALAAGLAIVEYKTGKAKSIWDAYKGSVIGVYNTVVQYLGPVVAFVQKVMGGVYNAVKGADLELAAKIAWNGLKIAWIDGLLWISRRTSGTFSVIMANLAAGRWKAAADGAMGMVQAAFLRVQNVADTVWTWVKNKADEAWTWIKSGADSMWVSVGNAFTAGTAVIEVAWVEMLEKMKSWAAEFLIWIRQNMIQPLVAWMEKSGLIPDSWAEKAREGMGAFMDIEAALQKSTLTDADRQKKTEGIREAAQAKQQKAIEDLKTRKDDATKDSAKRNEQRETESQARIAKRKGEIAKQEARGGPETVGSAEEIAAAEARLNKAKGLADLLSPEVAAENIAKFQAELARLKAPKAGVTPEAEAERNRLLDEAALAGDLDLAKKKAAELAQPGEPDLGGGKEKKGKGFIATGVGAYAAMMVGSASTPEEKTLKQMQKDAAERKALEKEKTKFRNEAIAFYSNLKLLPEIRDKLVTQAVFAFNQ